MKTEPAPGLKRSVHLWGGLLVGLAALVLAGGLVVRRPVAARSHPPEGTMAPGRTEAAPLRLQTFRGPSGWGYAIYAGSQRLIHQPFIPALPGNRGFATEQNARRAGQWVVGKIRRGKGPPSVTLRELDSLGVLD